MQQYKADLHIHTLLSPCGDLEMSPANVVEAAALKNIKILGIADHNSTKHAPLIKKLAEKSGIFTLCGAEVTTREEVHCLAFFETLENLDDFQQYLDNHITKIKNDPKYFGYQVVVDEDEMIVEQIDHLLISALNQSLDQVEQKIHSLNGLFIPAHIDRPKYSLTSQLGFVPPGIKADALEISKHTTVDQMLTKFPYLKDYTFISNSDAHMPDQLGTNCTLFHLQDLSFAEIRMALKGEKGRKAVL
ncbi:MAG: PHP domain-containing protein [Bacteroidota bacterium]